LEVTAPEADTSMTTENSPTGGQPAADIDEQQGAGEPSRLDRRQALHRLGQGIAGGAVVGAAAWLTPEMLIGRPTAAGAASAAPQGGGTTSGSSASPADAPAGGGSAATGSPDSPTSSTGGGGQLAFTGFDVERAVEAGAGLLVGGWALSRWSAVRKGDGSDAKAADEDSRPS
jgi:hypothetical protein